MRLLLFGLLLCFSIISQPLLANIPFQEISLEEARRQASQEDKLFFIHFTAGWCMPCRWMEENTFRDSDLVSYVKTNYLAVKVDIDRSEYKELQKQFEVKILPTILIFSASGALLHKVEAAVEANKLLRQLKKYNKPANHRAQNYQTENEPVLTSPKPQRSFSRPPLVPDEQLVESPPSYSQNYRPVSNKYMAPRGSKQFGVQTQVLSDYQEALELVKQMEEKFAKPVELQPKKIAGETVYCIIIGAYQYKSQARDFLNYLNRNDLTGQIVEISGE